MKKVIVTGATGFVGKHSLEPLLKKGYEVHAISTQKISSKEIIWHQLDLFDREKTAALCATIRATHLLHFAWTTTPGLFWSSPENIEWVEASLYLARQFVTHGGKRLVAAGTCAEYDWSYPCCEATNPFTPNTLYGTAKHSLYLLLKAFAKETKIDFAWGHLFFLYGPGEHPNRFLPSIIQGLLDKKEIPCSHGEQLRDFLHTEDAARAFVTLLDSTFQGNINIASGQKISLKQIATYLATLLGGSDRLQFGTLPTPSHEPPEIIANVKKLSDALNWTPRYSLEDGLKKVIATWTKDL